MCPLRSFLSVAYGTQIRLMYSTKQKTNSGKEVYEKLWNVDGRNGRFCANSEGLLI